MASNKSRSKSNNGGGLMTTETENQFGLEFYKKDGKLIIVKDDEAIQVDFDTTKAYKSVKTPPKIKKKEDSKMKKKKKHLSEDLTKEQVEEHYWNQNDSSSKMFEARVHKMMEANPNKSREECFKEVKTRMDKKPNETHANDMKEDIETVEEEVEKVEICNEEYDMLKSKSEKFDLIEKEKLLLEDKNKSLGERLDSLEAMSKDFREREAKRIEDQVNVEVKKLAHDNVVAEETIRDMMEDMNGKDDLEKINKVSKHMSVLIKPSKSIDANESTEDFQESLDFFDEQIKRGREEDVLLI